MRGRDYGERSGGSDERPELPAGWRPCGGRGRATGTLVLGEDPALELVPVERGAPLTSAPKAFREVWLGSNVRWERIYS
jgi:hypothetical protein